MPDTLTHEDKIVRNAFIKEAAPRHPGDFPAAIREGIAAFKAHRARLSQVSETPARATPQVSDRGRRIAAIVTETLTAAQAPTPPPAALPAAPSKPAQVRALHEMAPDELAAACAGSLTSGRSSPFWAPRETAPAAPVAESAGQQAPDVALHTLPGDALRAHAAAVLGEYGRGRGFASPGWR